MKKLKQLSEKLKRLNINTNLRVVLAVLVAGAVATYSVVPSQATAPSIYSVLNYSNAVAAPGVSVVSSSAGSIGGQTVDKVAPGAKLTYTINSLSYVNSECYYFLVLPQNGINTAKIEFGGIGSTTTIDIAPVAGDTPVAGGPQLFRNVCVNTTQGGSASGFNVFNLSPATGPSVLVYQDILNQPTYLGSAMGATNCQNVTEDENPNIQTQARAFTNAYESGGSATLSPVLEECGSPAQGGFVVDFTLTANAKSIADSQYSYVPGGLPQYKYSTTCNLTYINADNADISCAPSIQNGMPAEEFNLFE